MRVIHHTLQNGSGLNSVATRMALAEKRLGIESCLHYTNNPATAIKLPDPMQVEVLSKDNALTADIHVIHSHLPDDAKGKTVFVAHGTPEHCFNVAIEQHKASGYTAGDPFMLSHYRLNSTDVTVTFWDRHAYIWQSMCPKATVKTIPMGVDTQFWAPGPSRGKFSGNPSILSCENSHAIKWPLDLILAFPMLMKETKAVLHAHYLPSDQHRWWFPLLWATGVSYKSYTSGSYFDSDGLRNAFRSVDFYMNLVRYGDFNSVGIEAAATGAKVISYRGNPYADYWITEGDQRFMAHELMNIFSGKTIPRVKEKVPSIMEMANAMKEIYDAL